MHCCLTDCLALLLVYEKSITYLPHANLQFPAQFRDFSSLDVNHILYEATRIYGELVNSVVFIQVIMYHMTDYYLLLIYWKTVLQSRMFWIRVMATPV